MSEGKLQREPSALEQRIKDFAWQLREWSKPGKEDRAVLAALRLGLQGGASNENNARAWRYVTPFLAETPDERDQWFYLVGALFAWHPSHVPYQSFAQAFRKLKEDGASESTTARFMALLACNEKELPSHLRQCIGILRANKNGIGLDWEKLLRDLCLNGGWKQPRRQLQEKWAREFYGKQRPSKDADETKSAA